MANAVLISNRPEWVEKILSALEVRKNRPCLKRRLSAISTAHWMGWKHPFGIAYGRVVGEFVCDRVETISGGNRTVWNLRCGRDFVAQIGLVDGALGLRKKAALYGLAHFKLGIYDNAETAERIQGVAENEILICAC